MSNEARSEIVLSRTLVDQDGGRTEVQVAGVKVEGGVITHMKINASRKYSDGNYGEYFYSASADLVPEGPDARKSIVDTMQSCVDSIREIVKNNPAW